MKPIISKLFLLIIIALTLQGCSQPVNQPVTPAANSLIGTWEAPGIFANGYYSEFLRQVLTFNEDLSCVQDSYFESSGNLSQSNKCTYTVNNNEIRVFFTNLPSIKTVLNGEELTLSHPRGSVNGNPQMYTRVK